MIKHCFSVFELLRRWGSLLHSILFIVIVFSDSLPIEAFSFFKVWQEVQIFWMKHIHYHIFKVHITKFRNWLSSCYRISKNFKLFLRNNNFQFSTCSLTFYMRVCTYAASKTLLKLFCYIKNTRCKLWKSK